MTPKSFFRPSDGSSHKAGLLENVVKINQAPQRSQSLLADPAPSPAAETPKAGPPSEVDEAQDTQGPHAAQATGSTDVQTTAPRKEDSFSAGKQSSWFKSPFLAAPASPKDSQASQAASSAPPADQGLKTELMQRLKQSSPFALSSKGSSASSSPASQAAPSLASQASQSIGSDISDGAGKLAKGVGDLFRGAGKAVSDGIDWAARKVGISSDAPKVGLSTDPPKTSQPLDARSQEIQSLHADGKLDHADAKKAIELAKQDAALPPNAPEKDLLPALTRLYVRSGLSVESAQKAAQDSVRLANDPKAPPVEVSKKPNPSSLTADEMKNLRLQAENDAAANPEAKVDRSVADIAKDPTGFVRNMTQIDGDPNTLHDRSTCFATSLVGGMLLKDPKSVQDMAQKLSTPEGQKEFPNLQKSPYQEALKKVASGTFSPADASTLSRGLLESQQHIVAKDKLPEAAKGIQADPQAAAKVKDPALTGILNKMKADPNNVSLEEFRQLQKALGPEDSQKYLADKDTGASYVSTGAMDVQQMALLGKLRTLGVTVPPIRQDTYGTPQGGGTHVTAIAEGKGFDPWPYPGSGGKSTITQGDDASRTHGLGIGDHFGLAGQKRVLVDRVTYETNGDITIEKGVVDKQIQDPPVKATYRFEGGVWKRLGPVPPGKEGALPPTFSTSSSAVLEGIKNPS